MPGTNSFYPYGESSTNILNNSEYQTDSERSSGAQSGAIARSKMYNKQARQAAAGAYAVGALVAKSGKNADDSSAATLAANFQAAVNYQAAHFVASDVSVSGTTATATVAELATTAAADLPALFALSLVLDQALPAGASIAIASSLPDVTLSWPIYVGSEALDSDTITGGAITLLIDTVGARAFFKAGGAGVNETLPAQVTNFKAVQASGAKSVTVSWTKPSSYFSGILIVRKTGSAPTGVKDGTQAYKGTGSSFVDSSVNYGTTYYYRAFPYNSKGQYQTEYLVANVRPVAGIRLDSLSENTLIKIKESALSVLFRYSKKDYESDLNGSGKCLMVRNTGHSIMQWNDTDTVEYSTSTIDAWLNSTYKNLFSAKVRSLMGSTKFEYTTGSYTSSTLSRSVFLLSMYELGYDPNGPVNRNDFMVEGERLPNYSILQNFTVDGDNSNNRQWTRSRFRRNDYSIGFYYGVNDFLWTEPTRSGFAAARPCFTLPGSALVNPTPNSDGSYTLIES